MDYSWMTDEMMGFCELKSDRRFSVLTQEQRTLYVRGAMEIARKVYMQVKNENLREIMEKDGVRICYRKERQQLQSPLIQAQIIYEKKDKRLEIFETVLAEMVPELQKAGIAVSEEQFLEMHIAHEFYHFYEISRNQRTGELLPPVRYRSFLGLERKGSLTSVSEIAAHYFTRLYCHTVLHPKALDYIYLMQREDWDQGAMNRLLLAAGEMTAAVW